jgi:hypothetical protein
MVSALRSLPLYRLPTRKGLPPNTKFDLFVLQLPKEPYGIAWYEGDVETNAKGRGEERYIGRFNAETFAMAPESGSAPVVHGGADASANLTFKPIHTYHLGLFFDSPGAARQGGCPGTITPFNGEHRAGIKALSTRNFPDDKGPLRRIAP